ncbi:MAG: trypsin-like peptidase domain-containing protein, partial [Desulfamplus sp.]|nr:trypsin-like peptidase domain-containing protein [Desulfamplus sp.]
MRKLIFITAVVISAIFAQMPEGGITSAFGYTGDALLLNLQESISQAVATVRPSVVSVRAQKKQQASGGGANDFIWFESIGSGFIVDKRGYVLTNLHVVNGSLNIEISLWRSQDRIFGAKIVDEDESLDLALLKIETNQVFPAAQLGNSDMVETGNYVICIGSPFGFNHTVTMGIVSDLDREMVIDGVTYKNMIQTDAVINEGNSGGPVIDIYGRVVGVGTAIYAPDGTYRGIGFAIPINRTKHFFSRVTGAIITAAATTQVAPDPRANQQNQQPALTKEPVNLNKRMPNDAIHKEFSDCTSCHTITQKMVVSVKSPMPHPPVDSSCDVCHILTNDPVTRGPVPVAATVPMAGQPVAGFAGMPVASPLAPIAGGTVNKPLNNSIDQLAAVPGATFSTLNETF